MNPIHFTLQQLPQHFVVQPLLREQLHDPFTLILPFNDAQRVKLRLFIPVLIGQYERQHGTLSQPEIFGIEGRRGREDVRDM
jgi:hypothetical protein